MITIEKEEYITPDLEVIDLKRIDIITASQAIESKDSGDDEGDVDDPFGGDI